MVRLPSREDLPAFDPAGAVGGAVDYSGAIASAGQVGAAGRRVASAIGGLGSTLFRIGDQMRKEREEAENFQAKTNWLQFEQQNSRAFEESRKNMQPGGEGFVQTEVVRHRKAAESFIDTLPERLKPEYDQKLLKNKIATEEAALRVEEQERVRFQGDLLDSSIDVLRDRTMRQPDAVDDVLQEAEGVIDAAPHLSEIEKDQKKREVRAQIKTDQLEARIERGDARGVLRDLGEAAPGAPALLARARRLPNNPLVYLNNDKVPDAEYQKVDPRLRAIIEETARRTGVQVEVRSGRENRRSGFHPSGKAIDIYVLTPDGQRIPHGEGLSSPGDAAAGARTYEQFARAARAVQMEMFPELADQFRWGGYFGGGPGQKYGALDTMQFDLGGSAMAGGSWEEGWTTDMIGSWTAAGYEFGGPDLQSISVYGMGPQATGIPAAFEQALIQRESSGNPAAVNQFGYAGLYQLGAPRLYDLGLYKGGVNEDFGSWSRTSATAGNKWSGRFEIPGFPDVKTLDDFLANPAAQQAAFRLHIADMNETIARKGWDQHFGKTINGVMVTPTALYAAMHLGGEGGAEKFLRGEDVSDAFGTSVREYAQLGAMTGGTDQFVPVEPNPAYLDLPADRRESLRQAARKAIQGEEQEVIEAVETRRKEALDQVEIAIMDDPERVMEYVTTAREAGIAREPAEIKRLMNTAEKYAKDFMIAREDDARLSSGIPLNPASSDDRKVVDRVFAREVPIENLMAGEPAAVAAAVDVVRQTRIIPSGAREAVSGMLRSTNPQTLVTGLEMADRLEAVAPEAFALPVNRGGISTDARQRFYAARTLSRFMEPTELVEHFRKASDPGQKAFRDKAREAAKDELDEIETDDIVAEFDEDWLRDPTISPQQAAVMRADFDAIYEAHRHLFTDPEEAKRAAIKELGTVWGVSRAAGRPRVMEYPPERFAGPRDADEPVVDLGNWMRDQLKEAADEAFGEDVDVSTVHLVTDARTRRAIAAGQPPVYALVREVDGRFESVPGAYVRFDYDLAKVAAEAKNRQAAQDMQAKWRDFQRMQRSFYETGAAPGVPGMMDRAQAPRSAAEPQAAPARQTPRTPQIPAVRDVTPRRADLPTPGAPVVTDDAQDEMLRLQREEFERTMNRNPR